MVVIVHYIVILFRGVVEVRTLLVIFLLRTPCNSPMLIEHPVDFL